jgi:hypothetical protein
MSETINNLKEAFAGESQANRRYLTFAIKADQEGLPNIAKLFRFLEKPLNSPKCTPSLLRPLATNEINAPNGVLTSPTKLRKFMRDYFKQH